MKDLREGSWLKPDKLVTEAEPRSLICLTEAASFKRLSDQLARSKCLRKCSGSQKTAGWMVSPISARARTASFASQEAIASH